MFVCSEFEYDFLAFDHATVTMQHSLIRVLGASTIRLAIRKRQLRAQKVGRRVLVKRNDLESFLEANPIEALSE